MDLSKFFNQSRSHQTEELSLSATDNPQHNSGLGQSLILEPILTPSGLVDSLVDDSPELGAVDLGFDAVDDVDLYHDASDTDPTVPDLTDLSTSPATEEPFEELPFIESEGDEENAVAALTPQRLEDISSLKSLISPFESGQFVVGETGAVTIDYLFDGGKYQGELAIFSLAGMEQFELGSEAFIQEAAERALSESLLGHVVISDQTEGARFSGELGERGWNRGDYRGAQTFQMRPGDEFGFMLVPNGQVQDVADNPAIAGARTPLFSLATANPDDAFYTGQLADVIGDGNTFVFEDIRTDGQSDLDYNDLIFQVSGATSKAESLDTLLTPENDWRDSDLGQALIDYTRPYVSLNDGVDAIAAVPVADQPLVGIIDTGFSGDNPDIDYRNITLGSDRVDGDADPLLTADQDKEHGTHILGLIAAEQDNGLGIDGINDDAPVWLGRGIGAGTWAESLIEFVDAAQESNQPTAIANLSLDLTQISSTGEVTTRYEFTPMEMAALEYARQNNVLVVVAAGNDGDVMSALGQASQQFDNIITVGAAETIDGQAPIWQGMDRANYSSYGDALTLVADGGTAEAPILSTMGDGIGGMSGTSVATAKVTGAASQVWAANPDLSYRQVIDILQKTATDLNEVNPDVATGAGFLNMAAAVHLARATQGEPYTPELRSLPTTWSGEGIFTPMERAARYALTLKDGESLWAIARRELGDGNRWTELTKDAAGQISFQPGEAGQTHTHEASTLRR